MLYINFIYLTASLFLQASVERAQKKQKEYYDKRNNVGITASPLVLLC